MFLALYQGFKFLFVKKSGFEAEDTSVLGRFAEKVPFGTESGSQGHDGPLTNRVDGWVGDLGEELLEVSKEKPRIAGQGSEWYVVSHREDGLLGSLDHGREDHVKILGGDAVGHLLAREFERFEVYRRDVCGVIGEILQCDAVFINPFGIGFLGSELSSDFFVIKEFAGLGVCREHLAGSEASTTDYFFVGQDDGTGLGTDVKKPILGESEAGRA